MTKREFLKTELLKSIYPKIKTYGFKLNKGSCEFTQKNIEGWNQFGLIFLLNDDGWEINPGMRIRKNRIEDIYHKTSGFEEKYQKGTPTIATPIKNYLDNPMEAEFYLIDENQIDEFSMKLVSIFETMVLSFFEKYQSIEAIDHALNDDPLDMSLTGMVFKGSKGLIAAKLVQRPGYQELVKIYTKQYEQQDDGFYLPEFLALVKDLEENY